MEIVNNRTRKVKFGELFTDGCCLYQKIELAYSFGSLAGAKNKRKD